ncbi:hypothetical protein Btru_017540 [Bulinus truncatus]|nr:hypothetical protein Btru_017540 [Bulinus truncatus]
MDLIKEENCCRFSVKPEVEICESEICQEDLYVKCNKNPGHLKFISPRDLTLDHFPKSYRDDRVLDLIKALANLTVLISVNVTSISRPSFYPDTSMPYPYYEVRGQHKMRFGSGQVWRIQRATKVVKTAKTSGLRPRRRKVAYGIITVVTTAHLIFNDEEGKAAVCRLDYNSDDGSFSDAFTTIQGDGVRGSNVKRDRCVLRCVTYDMDLVDELKTRWLAYKRLCREVNAKHGDRRDKKKLTITVSHPHGLSKKITVGRWTHRFRTEDAENLTAYTYTASTCPGSSGAPVCTFGGGGMWWLSTHLHMGATELGNQSCISWE